MGDVAKTCMRCGAAADRDGLAIVSKGDEAHRGNLCTGCRQLHDTDVRAFRAGFTWKSDANGGEP